MMKKLIPACILLFAIGTIQGCSGGTGESDLTKEDRTKMDKLFREGVKPPPGATPTAGERGKAGNPINQADK